MLTQAALSNRVRLGPGGPLRYWPRSLYPALLLHTDTATWEHQSGGDLPNLMGERAVLNTTLKDAAAWTAGDKGRAVNLTDAATQGWMQVPIILTVLGGTIAFLFRLVSGENDTQTLLADDGADGTPINNPTIKVEAELGGLRVRIVDDTSTKQVVPLGVIVAARWYLLVFHWAFGDRVDCFINGGGVVQTASLAARATPPDNLLDIGRGDEGYLTNCDIGCVAYWPGKMLGDQVSEQLWAAHTRA